ncbi:MAG: AEC family transporter [Clostridia bacterium]|nr:AEC family transporter [Clostridia bacterium]
MLESMLTVGNQVAAMYLIMAVGFILVKLKTVTNEGASQLTKIVLNIVTPCLIINAFLSAFSKEMLKSLALSFILSAAVHIAGILIPKLFFGKCDITDKSVLRMACMYSNGGFMGLPIISAVLGAKGVIYGSVFIVVFNAFIWTHGVATVKGEKAGVKLKAFLNPGIIGISVSLLLFFLDIKLPSFTLNAISLIAGLNTPLAMIVTGAYLAFSNPLKAFADARVYLVCLFKLAVMPAILVGLALLLGADSTVIRALSISAGAPTASMTLLFAANYNKNSALAGGIVAVTTLLCVATLPIVVYLTSLL